MLFLYVGKDLGYKYGLKLLKLLVLARDFWR